MAKQNIYHKDAAQFADILKQTKLNNKISIGKFLLSCMRGVTDIIQYNQAGLAILNNQHEYTLSIQDGDLQVSLQLHENILNHYRLFCYTKINKKQGMTFSVNLATKKENDNVIYLAQKIKFAEQYEGSIRFA